MKLEKIKLKQIVNEQLTTDELELLKGGEYTSGCSSHACYSYAGLIQHECKFGDGICRSGIYG
ncbi:hypothetical protein FACS1894182_12910 [Bacteroidia bacterium]|nr:hypothetical protein FACS1894182_12910 [Bacteroidia bacterium]